VASRDAIFSSFAFTSGSSTDVKYEIHSYDGATAGINGRNAMKYDVGDAREFGCRSSQERARLVSWHVVIECPYRFQNVEHGIWVYKTL
jgi:hypothetical protein